MPDHNYTVTYVVPGSGNKHLQIVVLDCGQITDNDPGVDYWIPKANQAVVRAQHLAWLNATLSSSSATWVFVVSTYESKLVDVIMLIDTIYYDTMHNMAICTLLGHDRQHRGHG